jgi:2'-5' RNA ligase
VPDGDPGPYQPGETALLAVIDEAEPLVGHWRRRFDSGAALGIPPHVTVLYPFLAVERIASPVLDELTIVLGDHRSFAVRFGECRRFPGVLYLAPAPDQPFRALTESVAARWPEAPPYRGQYADVIPHMTIAHGQEAEVLREVETVLSARLPVEAQVSVVSLFVNDGERWLRHADFPLLA